MQKTEPDGGSRQGVLFSKEAVWVTHLRVVSLAHRFVLGYGYGGVKSGLTMKITKQVGFRQAWLVIRPVSVNRWLTGRRDLSVRNHVF